MTKEDKEKLEYVCSDKFKHITKDMLKDMTTDEKKFIFEWYSKIKTEGVFDKDYNEPFDLALDGFIDNEGFFHPDENRQVIFHNCRFAEPADNDVTISIRFDNNYEQV